jgi:E3 ubiquitin-protein ligase synoviolin
MWGKLLLYTAVSSLAAYGVVNHAYVSRGSEFYPAAIYLATNKASLLALGNMAACVIVIMAAVLKAFFLGSLKPSEVERVTEALKYTIPEVLIALTIFREELSLRVLSLFAMLLFSKFFHVLADERMNEVRWSNAPS